jgi:hypothetical protein
MHENKKARRIERKGRKKKGKRGWVRAVFRKDELNLQGLY